MKIRAYVNENISLNQIDRNNEFEGKKIDKWYVVPKVNKEKIKTPVYQNAENDPEDLIVEESEEGDIVITSTFVNFSRSLNVMLRLLRQLTDKGVRVISTGENFDSDSKEGKALLESIPVLQKYNRNNTKDRIAKQQEGVDKAKEEGKYTTQGRKPIRPEQFDRFAAYYSMFIKDEMTKKEFSERLGVSRPTLDKLINQVKGGSG